MSSNTDEAETMPHKMGWSKRKIIFVVAVILVFLVVSALAGISLHQQLPQPNDSSTNNQPLANDSLPITPVLFTVHLNSSGQVFTTAVKINLTDGMDQDEAVEVATDVFNATINAQYSVKSVSMDKDSVWTVEFRWGYQGEPLGHWFKAVINPIDRTVVYDRCR
jgi:regulatory protein YycI of two-component signal transduction system YycFG